MGIESIQPPTSYSRAAAELRVIQKQISDFEHRRMSTLREIAYHDHLRAKQLQQKSLEIIDGSFSAAAE